jgi:hypothetical protein
MAAATLKHLLLCGNFLVPMKPADSSDILKERTDDKDNQVSKALLCFLMAGGAKERCGD